MVPEQDERVARLRTPEDCELFAINMEKRGQLDLARAARRRAVELRALAHNPGSAAELEALEAVYAYERVLSQGAGKKIRASRTWQMIKRRGLIPAVESVVTRPLEARGYIALVQMGMEAMAFEAVVLRHSTVFSSEAVEKSRTRLETLKSHQSKQSS